MECNKEEASRAKDVAERRLQEADFPGAKKMVLKAHRLFPGLENISQMLAVCEVHCSASVKINGETDWYGILQVEPTADDMVLKKQYRKLALLLHPDKNKFAGAEAAFKLIGEAHMTLTDQVKRHSHDNKRKPVFATSIPVPKKRGRASKKTDPAHKRDNKENSCVPDIKKTPQQQAGKSAEFPSFWTICLTCGKKYQYPCSFLMKFVLCQICSRRFLAFDLSKKSVPAQVDAEYPSSGFGTQPQKFPPSQQADASNQQHNPHQQNQSFPGWQNPITGHPTHPTHQQSKNVPNHQTPTADQQRQSHRFPPSTGSENVISSEASGDPNKKGATYSNLPAKAGICNSTKVPRASFKEENGAGRAESLFVYSDKLSPINMQKKGIQSQHVPGQQTPIVNQQDQSQKPTFNAGLDNTVSSQGAGNPNSKGTADNNVRANARSCNSMKSPRAAPNEENDSIRTESPLASSDKVSPANMGKRAREVATESRYPVSMHGKKDQSMECVRNVAGAVKTGQNPKRSSQQENISNEDGSGGCREGIDNLHDSPVAKRIRKGYSSCNADRTGGSINEDGNVHNTQRRSIPVTKKTPNKSGEVVNGLYDNEKQGASKKEEMPNSERNGSVRSVGDANGGVSYPDPEFYDFEENRRADQFKADQIWAVYDDNDSMPRYYARIKQVYSPNFMLSFSWLEFDPVNDAEKAWSSKELPVACGSFRIGKTTFTEDRNMFSHVVAWTKGRKRNSYEIHPVKGDVWALLKGCEFNWSSDSSDHKHCSYDIVEIKSDFTVGTGIYVTPLMKVKGFVSLFVRPDKEEPYLIPGGDKLRFSHNIPFHRLSGADRQHIPNGALELDPASLPSNLEEASSPVDLGRNVFSTQKGNIGGNVSSTGNSLKCEMPVGKTKQGLDSAATQG
ncbi:uncharacterized protein [Lolium perenne]|uniref:uncharacterized protein isoform X1 n=1 Tax=Lolium perenne TaxID=4522 RepID=UPI0021F65B7C|nr:uncharacterized protein LOC127314526 isoform X1 [Lolium perenne]XP_051200971.1 uncharacterized protein LOC127314526 isoform X1 [Lolium perenne]